MIRPKRLVEVGIVVRDLKRSLKWYRKKFGFKRIFAVSNGVVIGDRHVHLWIAQVRNPARARKPDYRRDICMRLITFEVSKRDLRRVEAEFPEDRHIAWIEHPKYFSAIVEDPDGHAIELLVTK